MSETFALFELSLRCSRWLLLTMLAAVSVGMGIAWYFGSADLDRSITAVALFFTLVPAAISTIALFDYGLEGDLSRAASGCSHWLLRMPVHPWKIAIVPIILKTLWVSAMYVATVLTLRHLGSNANVPLLFPSLCLSAVAVWVLVIAWRPFRSGWRRMITLLVTLILLYGTVLFVFAAPHLDQVDWRPAATIAANALTVISYFGAVALAIHSVKLARTNADGLIPAIGRRDASELATEGLPVREFRSVYHALIHHTWVQMMPWTRKVFLVAVIPATIGLVFLPLHVVSIVTVFVLLFELAAVSSSSNALTTTQLGLPPYLAASPLRDATIAWTQSLVPLVVSAVVLGCIPVIFLGWACWPENRDVWMQWATERTAALEGSDPAAIVGLRLSIAITFGLIAAVLCQLASFYWIAMSGRSWFIIASATVFILIYMAPVNVVLRWFLQQSSWEGTMASASHYLSYAPQLVLALLLVKCSTTGTSVALLVRKRLLGISEIAWIVALWGLLVLLVATVMHTVIPDPRATLLWCVTITAFTVPLARILLIPLMLSWNRHR